MLELVLVYHLQALVSFAQMCPIGHSEGRAPIKLMDAYNAGDHRHDEADERGGSFAF